MSKLLQEALTYCKVYSKFRALDHIAAACTDWFSSCLLRFFSCVGKRGFFLMVFFIKIKLRKISSTFEQEGLIVLKIKTL